ncbi:SDR family NAD(P)-dependent oxidoreductase [Spiroplasma endosymbiont of Panorpa germanica]|uniref:SDR family NAD(P)-dependent oxidoreductase n=1 Tax=Spiroplasma endosymbiont of Panorpa germanica TaxID=3066314 RepID=UPI0030D1F5C7
MKKNKTEPNSWAIVTGASKGIGYGYCEQLLTQGWNIIAVARNTDPLNHLSKKFPNQTILKINLDLSNLDNCDELFKLTKDLDVSLLINNAGYGVLGDFQSSNLEKELNMLDLNIRSLHKLSKIYVNHFFNKQKGRIINISSVAAFLPGPGFASYYASKAYVLNLGTAINYELIKGKSKVRLITICPGPIKTEFWNRSKGETGTSKSNTELKNKSVDKFVKSSLNKALKAKRRSYFIIGFNNIFLNKMLNIVPKSWAMRVVYKYNKKKNK